jgi:hypothetical protein
MAAAGVDGCLSYSIVCVVQRRFLNLRPKKERKLWTTVGEGGGVHGKKIACGGPWYRRGAFLVVVHDLCVCGRRGMCLPNRENESKRA